MQQHEAFVNRKVQLAIKLGEDVFVNYGTIAQVNPDSVLVIWVDGRGGLLFWNHAVKANAYQLEFISEERLRGPSNPFLVRES